MFYFLQTDRSSQIVKSALGLALTLFVAWVGTNNAHNTFAADNLAIAAHFFN
jgi:hypothetical protein